MQNQKSLMALFIPIALETLFMMLTGMADTFMLASVSDAAVGAVGTANTYINIFIITFGIISSGLVAVVTQFIGAGRIRAAGQTLTIGLWFNALIGGLISLLLLTQTNAILRFAGIADLLLEPAQTYLKIVGGFCFVNALITVLSSYLRAFGFTRQSLFAGMGANVANLILNGIFLYGLGWGVAGVALATVISRIGNLLVCWVCVRVKIHTDDGSKPMDPRQILGQIIRIGLPAAFETALYNVAAALTVRFLNQMDPNGIHVTAKTYAQQLTNFCFCASSALAQANALVTGWLVGAGKFDDCYRKTNRVGVIAIFATAGIAALLALLAKPLLGLFTEDAVLIAIAARLMVVDIFLEMGRASNLVFGQALKVSGDSIYPSVIGAIFMYLVMVGGSWLLGLRLEMLSLGVFLAMAGDECIRAVLMWLRWRSGKWRTKGVIAPTFEGE